MSDVRHGLCIGGPKDKQTLATLNPGVARHADDASGYYVFKQAMGPDPARWLWIKADPKDDKK